MKLIPDERPLVRLDRPCICKGRWGYIGEGVGPHHGKIVCENCERFQRWLPKPKNISTEIIAGVV